MGFSVNLNFDFSGPNMGKAVDDASRASKANLESNQTTISPTQQTTSASTFQRQNNSSVETLDLSSEVTSASKAKGFKTKTGNNNTTLGKASTTASPMGTSSTKVTGQSSQAGTSMDIKANGISSKNMTESTKANTSMGSLGESKQASIGNKGNDTKQTGMNISSDNNKGINIKENNFSKTGTNSLESNKGPNLNIKGGNNSQSGMNGNISASGSGKNESQSIDISRMDIETLGDEPVETTMKNTNVGKQQTINTDKGGFKSIHSETVQVNEKDMEETGGFLGGVVSFFTGLAEDVGEAISGWAEDVSAWWNEEAAPVLKDISSAIGDFFVDTGAAVVTGVISLGEGLLSFGEAIVDTGAIILTGVASIGTGLVDLGQALYGLVTGEEWESVTKQMWEGTQGFVATEHVKSWFDGFYENTEVGRFLKENANLFGLVDFDTIRSVGSGIGYTVGVVALTVLTFGAGGATVSAGQLATTAAAAGFGKGTESAWKDGASIGEGLVFGGLNGVWEGFQFYIGGKIAGFGNAGNTFLGHSMKGFENKALNAFTRVILDGADGGLEGFAQPLMATIYKDGYTTPEGEYVEFTSDMNIVERAGKLFKSYGGWGNVATQAFIGSAMSIVGEGFDLRRYLKEGQEAKIETGVINESKVDSEPMRLRQENIKSVATLNEATTIENNVTLKLDSIVKQDINYVLSQIMDRSQITKLESLEKINELLNTRNFNVITRQGDARRIIKQYSFEQIENTYRQLYKEAYDQLEADINYAVEKLLPKVGMDETKAFNQVIALANTGDYTKITRDGNARAILQQYRIQDIAQGLNIIFQKRQTIQSLEQVLTQIQARNGISLEKALRVIENYTITGNLNLITRQGNARDIIKSLKLEQIGEALISIKAKYFKDNNSIDVTHIFNDLWNSLNSGTQSNVSVMNLLYSTLAQAYTNGNPYALKLTQLVTDLKKANPQISLQALNYNNAYWDLWNKQLCMGASSISMGDSGTMMHELGHGLFDMILNGQLPKDWDSIVGKSRVISSNNGTLYNFGNILRRKEAELNAKAEQEFLSNLNAQGKTLDSYTIELEKHYSGMFKNANKLLIQKLKDLGYSEDRIDSMINGKVTPSLAAQQQIYAEKSLIKDKLWRTQEGDYCALSDIVDAVFIGEKKDIYNNDIHLNYQHGKEYYIRSGNSKLYEFHEIIANFTQLKLTGKKHHIQMLRDIFGNEFVDKLEETFESFFNQNVQPLSITSPTGVVPQLPKLEVLGSEPVKITPIEEKNTLDHFRIMNSDIDTSQAGKNLDISNKIMQSELTPGEKISQIEVPSLIINKKIPRKLDGFLKRVYSDYSELQEKLKIDIKATTDNFIPDTRIPLQLLINADGTKYYLKSRIVPTAAKVDSSLKHISELVQGTFTVPKLVPNIDRIKLLLGNNAQIPDKIPELQKMIRQELENSGNITDAHQLTMLLDECFYKQLQPNTKGIRKNMISAGLKSEFDILEQYGLANLPSDILTNIQGYAGLSLYLNGLQKYARKDLMFPSAEFATKDLMGLPTWVDAGLGDKPYYIEVITRKPQAGELGDEVAFHLVHKSARKELVDMPSSASKQGKKLLLDILVDIANSQNRKSYYRQFFEDVLPTTGLQFDSLTPSGKSEITSQFLKRAQDLAIKRIDEGSTRIYDTEFHDLAEHAIIDCIQSQEIQQIIQNLIQASYHSETLNMEDIIKELRRHGKE